MVPPTLVSSTRFGVFVYADVDKMLGGGFVGICRLNMGGTRFLFPFPCPVDPLVSGLALALAEWHLGPLTPCEVKFGNRGILANKTFTKEQKAARLLSVWRRTWRWVATALGD